MKNTIVFFLCLALFSAACSQNASPQPATSLTTTPTGSPTQVAASTATPTLAGEAPIVISPSPSVIAQPAQVSPTATPITTLPDLPQVSGSSSCPGALVSMLMPGRKGRVSNASAATNRLRSQPTTQGEIIAEIPAGAYFDVLLGPQCADGMAWFKVRSETGVQGWMAEGSGDEYWVMPVLTAPQNVTGPELLLPGFTLNLPAEVGSKMQILSQPFEPATRTPPVTIARFADYPLPGQNSAIYVYPLQDYLYYRPEGRASLEQLRSAINALMANPNARVSLANVVVSLSMHETYLAQAGPFNGGSGVRAIAKLGSVESSQATALHYAFWGFSQDMKYLIFAALDLQVASSELSQVTTNDFNPPISLLDQIFQLETGPVEPAPIALDIGPSPTPFALENLPTPLPDYTPGGGMAVLVGESPYELSILRGGWQAYQIGPSANKWGYLVDITPLQPAVKGAYVEYKILPEYFAGQWVDVLWLRAPNIIDFLPVRLDLIPTKGWKLAYEADVRLTPGECMGFGMFSNGEGCGGVLDISPASADQAAHGAYIENTRVQPEYPGNWVQVIRVALSRGAISQQASLRYYSPGALAEEILRQEASLPAGVWSGWVVADSSANQGYVVEVIPLKNADNEVAFSVVQPRFNGTKWEDVLQVYVPEGRPALQALLRVLAVPVQ